MDTLPTTECSLALMHNTTSTMHSLSHTEVLPTIQVTLPSGKCFIDTSSVQFQKSLDLGVTQIGAVTMRATLMVDDKKLDIGRLDQAPALLVGDTEAGQFFARRHRNPAHAARMSAATMKLGQALEATHGKHTGLLALRMQAGLSQAELAQRMGTHQPSIARWERTPMTMSGQNMKAMAIALGVPAVDVFTAIQEQCEIVIKAVEHEIT